MRNLEALKVELFDLDELVRTAEGQRSVAACRSRP